MSLQGYCVFLFCVAGAIVCFAGILLIVADLIRIDKDAKLRERRKTRGRIVCNERGIHDCVCDSCMKLRAELVSR